MKTRLSILCCAIAISAFSQKIKVNQIGYYPSAQKLAVVPGADTGSVWLVNNMTREKILVDTLPATASTWSPSGESIKMADFSTFTTPGTYYVKTSVDSSLVFEIKTGKVYDSLLTWATKGFYFWRASTAIESQYATYKGTDYKRNAGHLDNSVVIHASAATAKRPAGTKISAPRGWYDAGDYNLYVVNAGFSVYFLAHSYELYPDFFKKYSLNIPESNNNTPDILDELKWEYDWLLAMQDLDSGVYFKLTSKSFDGYEMPERDRLTRYMVGKSTSSALDFAAMTAIGYRIFKDYSSDYPGFADQCLAASERAWAWAKAHPGVSFTNPSDVSTGGYGDASFSDEFFWAAAELLISTNKKTYSDALNFNLSFSSPGWQTVGTLGLMSLMLNKDILPSYVNKTIIQSKYTALMTNLYSTYSQSAYKVPMTNFYWGSNGDMSTRAALLGDAYVNLGDIKYLNASMEGLNYVLGRNATGYCFVTGFGHKSPLNIHDRRSISDGIVKPIPGYLAGGPNTDAPSDCGASLYPSTKPAMSYVDANCSYSTNEIAINWNAPLVALAATIEFSNNPQVAEKRIFLDAGWNLMSINIRPADTTITSVFSGLDVDVVKNMDVYWQNGQSGTMNTLSAITPGEGYLVKMNAAGTLIVSGSPITAPAGYPGTDDNLQLKGCPFQRAQSIPTFFNAANSFSIKSFDGFWKPGGTLNSILNIEPGKAYFVSQE